MLDELLRRQVREGPRQHGHCRVTLEEGGPRQGSVVLALGIGLEGVDAEGGVLECVGVFVGVRNLRLGVEARIGHDDHALASSS